MPAVTVYLSRLIGIVCLILATAALYDKAVVLSTIEHLGQDRMGLLLVGGFRVVCGAGIVLVHNVWTRGFWPLVVTLTGWVVLVRGVMNLFLPLDVMAALVQSAHAIEFYYVYAAIPLVLGAYLTLRGFGATVASRAD